ncbi:MAG TPA: TatD family hydrolase [Polyangiaceae bacterium]|nr:TatD family hydrolase [Polyangiaceae bacterium]
MLIDTHCHLDSKYFPGGAAEPILRAQAEGVAAFICIGVGSLERARETAALPDAHACVVATVGVHPHEAEQFQEAQLAEYTALGRGPKIVAIGEIGLDYYYSHSPKQQQQQVFRRFIALAKELHKPIVIHTRDAPEDTLAILKEEGAQDVGGVIHCFSEGIEFARGALDLGFDLSFSGIVTFKNAAAIQEVAAWAPADRILVETDSPYLAPIPFRGKPNEPARIVHTANKVAQLRNIDAATVAQLTTENALRRFGPSLATAASIR